MIQRFLIISCLAFLACTAHLERFEASKIRWNSLSTGVATDVPNTVFSLMAGSFTVPVRPDGLELVKRWLKNHPKATVIPVTATRPLLNNKSDSKFVFVWIEDGTSNLNIELVRQGCFPARTQALAGGENLEVSRSEYEAFLSKVDRATSYAKRHKLGIWGGKEGLRDEPD